MKLKIGLLGRIIIAIILAVLLGTFVPEWFVRTFATFNSIFGGFLKFIVPLIIIAFIAPGIAKLGKGQGNCSDCNSICLYFNNFCGILAYFTASSHFAEFIGGSRKRVLKIQENR